MLCLPGRRTHLFSLSLMWPGQHRLGAPPTTTPNPPPSTSVKEASPPTKGSCPKPNSSPASLSFQYPLPTTHVTWHYLQNLPWKPSLSIDSPCSQSHCVPPPPGRPSWCPGLLAHCLGTFPLYSTVQDPGRGQGTGAFRFCHSSAGTYKGLRAPTGTDATTPPEGPRAPSWSGSLPWLPAPLSPLFATCLRSTPGTCQLCSYPRACIGHDGFACIPENAWVDVPTLSTSERDRIQKDRVFAEAVKQERHHSHGPTPHAIGIPRNGKLEEKHTHREDAMMR